ncbi:NAD(P)-binding domain-containing protein [Streptomyces sp. PKU-EA00015]|uniref:flavin-containing monooxygenase n=1 Tax=Streptomyces sp. PKU-EA00015 TaxID=2748326 RepID=UPI00159FCBD7|nr:NAD(P)-binding domain-containing protein [Streptomyces sp. PKU-EA00015]NWF31351.1 NAD(P)-binding domain-containing protein [Streptomyces sp. PKU-EA00015]
MSSEPQVDPRPVAVIGAGPSGLASLKNLSDLNIPCVGYESHSGVGGIWDIDNPRSSVYQNTHTITSREVTGYADLPMDRGLPAYPRHDQVRTYLQQYAERFDLRRLIRFDSDVTEVERLPDGWRVTTADGHSQEHSALIIANGHNWHPHLPSFEGKFDGEILHSRDYTNPAGLAGKRVLVVGAGNSGCDIAVEAAGVSDHVAISMRRGYYFFPKFIFGKPADQVSESSQNLRLPAPVARAAYRTMLKLSIGSPDQFGLPKPDHEPLESPPIVNSLLPYYCAHGRVKVRKAPVRFDGKFVEFSDGTSEEFDTVIMATGFRIHIPFVGEEHLDWNKGRPDFYLLAFSPRYDDLFIAGMTDGTGGHFPTVELQSRVIAAYLAARRRDPEAARSFDELKRRRDVDISGGIKFLDSPRNLTQFELLTYLRVLREHLSLLGGQDTTYARRPSLLEQAAALFQGGRK